MIIEQYATYMYTSPLPYYIENLCWRRARDFYGCRYWRARGRARVLHVLLDKPDHPLVVDHMSHHHVTALVSQGHAPQGMLPRQLREKSKLNGCGQTADKIQKFTSMVHQSTSHNNTAKAPIVKKYGHRL
jgi:hypothetical protein